MSMKFKILRRLPSLSLVPTLVFLWGSLCFAINCKSENTISLSWQILNASSEEYIAEASFGETGFYGAVCKPLLPQGKKFRCSIEPEWSFFEPVAFVELGADSKPINLQRLIPDRRYTRGYRHGPLYPLTCD